MKIRSQLILVGAGLNLALLLSVLFSIFLLLSYIRYEDSKIKLAVVQETAIRSRYYFLEMLVSVDPVLSIISNYEVLEEQLTQGVAELSESYFIRPAPDIQNEYQAIEDSWKDIRELIRIDDIISFLSIRNEADDIESLLSVQARIQELEQEESSFAEKIDNAIERIAAYESDFILFVNLLQDAMVTLSQTIDRYRTNLLMYAITIPVLIVLISIGGSSLFGAKLHRKLATLNNTLNKVIRGDFSVRVEMEGDDEFTNLAENINAFTKTLGSKLENFRLIMHDIGSTLETDLETTQIESTLLQLTMKETNANGAAIYRTGNEPNELILSVVEGKFRPPFVVSDLPGSPQEEDIRALLKSRIILADDTTIIGESAAHNKPIMIRDIKAKKGIDWKRSEDDPLHLSSIIVVPLKVGTTVIGVLTVTSDISNSLFTDLEYVNLQSLAEIAAISLESIYKYSELLDSVQLERDIGIAEEIQQSLLPKKMPVLNGASVACLSRSMKGLNGDYFDVYPVGDGKVMLTICEIVGRGIPASLVMVMIRTVLRIVARPDADALSIMNKLNQDMAKQVLTENFASVGVFLVDSDGRFTYSSAAQDSAKILRTATKEIEILHTEGIPIGIDKDVQFTQIIGKLNDKDLVLLHSDGIPESYDKDGNEFGVEKLLNIVKRQSESSPAQIVAAIRTELESFEQDTQQKDDQTAIVFKFDGRKVKGNAA